MRTPKFLTPCRPQCYCRLTRRIQEYGTNPCQSCLRTCCSRVMTVWTLKLPLSQGSVIPMDPGRNRPAARICKQRLKHREGLKEHTRQRPPAPSPEQHTTCTPRSGPEAVWWGCSSRHSAPGKKIRPAGVPRKGNRSSDKVKPQTV